MRGQKQKAVRLLEEYRNTVLRLMRDCVILKGFIDNKFVLTESNMKESLEWANRKVASTNCLMCLYKEIRKSINSLPASIVLPILTHRNG